MWNKHVDSSISEGATPDQQMSFQGSPKEDSQCVEDNECFDIFFRCFNCFTQIYLLEEPDSLLDANREEELGRGSFGTVSERLTIES